MQGENETEKANVGGLEESIVWCHQTSELWRNRNKIMIFFLFVKYQICFTVSHRCHTIVIMCGVLNSSWMGSSQGVSGTPAHWTASCMLPVGDPAGKHIISNVTSSVRLWNATSEWKPTSSGAVFNYSLKTLSPVMYIWEKAVSGHTQNPASVNLCYFFDYWHR